MISDLARLKGETGDFARLAGVPRGFDGIADASGIDWSRSMLILRGLTFDRVKVTDNFIRPQIDYSTYNHCQFIDVEADTNFWAGDNKWTACLFEDCTFSRLGSPANRFSSCAFRRVEWQGYNPYDTVFEDCEFTDCTFIGLKAPYLTRKAVNPDPELKVLSTSVLFRNCMFTRVKFRGCHFANIRFDGCTFDEPITEHSDFTDCIANPQWWPDGQQGAPLAALLEDMTQIATRKLGPQCKTISVLRQFLVDLARDPSVKREYVKRTVDDIPDDEQDALENEFLELGEIYSP